MKFPVLIRIFHLYYKQVNHNFVMLFKVIFTFVTMITNIKSFLTQLEY